MPKNKKPRKAYRPRLVMTNAVEYVVEGTRLVAQNSADVLLNIRLKNHSAMTALLRGAAQKCDMDILIAMHNVVEGLCRLGHGKDYTDCLIRGKCALIELCQRGARSGRFVCRAPEIQALNDLMELHDAQMDVVTVSDLEKAIAIAKHEIRTHKAQNVVSEVAHHV